LRLPSSEACWEKEKKKKKEKKKEEKKKPKTPFNKFQT